MWRERLLRIDWYETVFEGLELPYPEARSISFNRFDLVEETSLFRIILRFSTIHHRPKTQVSTSSLPTNLNKRDVTISQNPYISNHQPSTPTQAAAAALPASSCSARAIFSIPNVGTTPTRSFASKSTSSGLGLLSLPPLNLPWLLLYLATLSK